MNEGTKGIRASEELMSLPADTREREAVSARGRPPTGRRTGDSPLIQVHAEHVAATAMEDRVRKATKTLSKGRSRGKCLKYWNAARATRAGQLCMSLSLPRVDMDPQMHRMMPHKQQHMKVPTS